MTKDQAMTYFGSTTALARALLITYQAVHSWGAAIPPFRQLQIEMITGGLLQADRSVFPVAPPTLNANLRPISVSDQPGVPAVILSSGSGGL